MGSFPETFNDLGSSETTDNSFDLPLIIIFNN